MEIKRATIEQDANGNLLLYNPISKKIQTFKPHQDQEAEYALKRINAYINEFEAAQIRKKLNEV